MYTDQPSPGVFLLALLYGLLILLPAIFLTIYPTMPLMLTAFIGLLYLIPVIIIAVLLHAAYHVIYTLDDQVLTLKCGIMMNKKLAVRDILSVKKTKFNTRTMGYGYKSSGYCNRMTNGLGLITQNHMYYISPSDVERFRFELENRMERG